MNSSRALVALLSQQDDSQLKIYIQPNSKGVPSISSYCKQYIKCGINCSSYVRFEQQYWHFGMVSNEVLSSDLSVYCKGCPPHSYLKRIHIF